MSTTVAITGASGFLGRSLVERLSGREVTVRAYSRQAVGGMIRVDDYSDIASADIVVHCAQWGDARQVAAAGPEMRYHALSLTKALANKSGRLLFASSAIVYGDQIARARQTDEPVAPVNAYAEMKLASEEVVAKCRGTSIRLVNLCGAGQPQGTVLADILRQLGTAGPLLLRNAMAVRDFLWVSDAAEAIARMVVNPNLPAILNVGSGKGVSVGALAARILHSAGETGREVVSTGSPTESTLWVDISDTIRCLDWTPVQSIEQGIVSLLSKE